MNKETTISPLPPGVEKFFMCKLLHEKSLFMIGTEIKSLCPICNSELIAKLYGEHNE